MLWKACHERVQSLSPKAAKLAARMLRNDPSVPSNWVFSLDWALTFRSKEVGPLTAADLQAIAASQRGDRTAAPSFDPEQREAWEFAEWIRALAGSESERMNAPRNIEAEAPQEAIWDPRTPTPEERWLLAFSDELHRLANDRTYAEEIARLAMEKLTAEGHRNPVAVAREAFIAGQASRYQPAK